MSGAKLFHVAGEATWNAQLSSFQIVDFFIYDNNDNDYICTVVS